MGYRSKYQYIIISNSGHSCLKLWLNYYTCIKHMKSMWPIMVIRKLIYHIFHYCVRPFSRDLRRNVVHRPLQWRHNERYGVSNHQPQDCLLNRLFRCRSKKTSKLRVTGLYEGNSAVTGEFPHKGPVTRKCFHLMTSSCQGPISLMILSRNWMEIVLCSYPNSNDMIAIHIFTCHCHVSCAVTACTSICIDKNNCNWINIKRNIPI